MDPFTIASSVIEVSATCVRTARALYDLQERYKDASMTIHAIYSESTVISTSLGHIHMLISTNAESLRTALHERSDLFNTFDQALTGCVLVYSVLDDEVTRLYGGIKKEGMAAMLTRVKFLWKEEAMKDILVQIRGQQTALNLLIQVLQMTSLAEITTLLKSNTNMLQTVAQRTTKFRQANGRVKAPGSILNVAIDDVASLYSYDSRATSTDFSFDDVVVNSAAYRRALQVPRSPQQHLAPVQEQSEVSSGSNTLVDASSPIRESQKWMIPLGIRTKLTPEEVNTLVRRMKESMKADYEADVRAVTKLEELQTEFSTMKEKYVRVKRLYFDLMEQKEANLKQIDICNKEIERSKAERAEIQKLNEFLEEQYAKLKAENAGLQQFFSENKTARQVLVDAQEELIKTKDERIAQVEALSAKDKEVIKRLRDMNSTKLSQIGGLEKQLNDIKEEHSACTTRLNDFDGFVAQLQAALTTRDEELTRYRSFDSIIEQLRAISPQPSGTPSILTPRSPQATPSASFIAPRSPTADARPAS